MAPEQARGEAATPASDAFTLGLTLFIRDVPQPAVPGKNVLEILLRLLQFDGASLAADVRQPFAGILRQALVRDAAEWRITLAEIAHRPAVWRDASAGASPGARFVRRCLQPKLVRGIDGQHGARQGGS